MEEPGNAMIGERKRRWSMRDIDRLGFHSDSRQFLKSFIRSKKTRRPGRGAGGGGHERERRVGGVAASASSKLDPKKAFVKKAMRLPDVLLRFFSVGKERAGGSSAL